MATQKEEIITIAEILSKEARPLLLTLGSSALGDEPPTFGFQSPQRLSFGESQRGS